MDKDTVNKFFDTLDLHELKAMRTMIDLKIEDAERLAFYEDAKALIKEIELFQKKYPYSECIIDPDGCDTDILDWMYNIENFHW